MKKLPFHYKVATTSELNKSYRCLAVLSLLCIAPLSGCTNSDIRTSPVSGTVTIGGKAIADVEVYFCGNGLVAYGKTDAQGHYALVQGAAPGENKVYFNKVEGGNSTMFEEDGMDAYQMEMVAATSGKKSNVPKQIVPSEYSDAVNPKLNFLVPDGGTDSADFKL
ncbi:MAG: hypothetical protein R3C53_28185 [Pirellulaceae bacterium]